jgi:hypothetical protein
MSLFFEFQNEYGIFRDKLVEELMVDIYKMNLMSRHSIPFLDYDKLPSSAERKRVLFVKRLINVLVYHSSFSLDFISTLIEQFPTVVELNWRKYSSPQMIDHSTKEQFDSISPFYGFVKKITSTSNHSSPIHQNRNELENLLKRKISISEAINFSLSINDLDLGLEILSKKQDPGNLHKYLLGSVISFEKMAFLEKVS